MIPPMQNSKKYSKLFKHEDLVIAFRAFLGALYNCCGLQAASKFLKVVGVSAGVHECS